MFLGRATAKPKNACVELVEVYRESRTGKRKGKSEKVQKNEKTKVESRIL